MIYITTTTSTTTNTQHSPNIAQSSQNMKMIKNSQEGFTFINRITVKTILLADIQSKDLDKKNVLLSCENMKNVEKYFPGHE